MRVPTAMLPIVLLVLAGCGGDETADGERTTSPPATSGTVATTTEAPSTEVTTTEVTTTTFSPSSTTAPTTSTTTSPTTTTTAAAWPPADASLLTVVNPARRIITTEPTLWIGGTTLPGAVLVVDGVQLELEPDGVNWSTEVALDIGEQTILVTAVDGDDAAEVTLTVTLVPDLEVRFGHLHGIERGAPEWTLWVDEAVLLTGDEAAEYAGEEPVDGYVIVDEEPGVLVGVVADEHALMVMWEERHPLFPALMQVNASPGEVAAVLDGTSESPWWLLPEPFPVELYLDDGLVIQVVQRWFP
jgi:hypothetical protein